jgi:hypothetical protein
MESEVKMVMLPCDSGAFFVNDAKLTHETIYETGRRLYNERIKKKGKIRPAYP